MQFQTFRGSDVGEALSAVKAALGPDAVIKQTRHYNNGLGGGFRSSFVEVTAAPADPESQRSHAAERAALKSDIRIGERRNALLPAKPRQPPNGPELARLELEIQMLKNMLEELNSSRPPKDRAVTLLHSVGIEGELARDLAKGVSRAARSGQQELKRWLQERIERRIATVNISMQPEQATVIACVGPTGAGKTTTLAKIAARARLDYDLRVGVITLDTYRVGAVEQWRRYASILGLPLHVAENARGFAKAMAELKTDLILVDTAGRQRTDTAETWPIAACLEHTGSRARHVLAVMPAWLRARDAETTLDFYRDAQLTGAIITKLDESTQCGGPVQGALTRQLPLAYLCNGPRVPEDLDAASAQHMSRLLFAAAE